MKYILAIDQGTTSTRAIIIDHNQKVIKSAQKEVKNYFPHEGYVLQDPNEIWLSTLSVIQELFYDEQIDVKDIISIGISNQRETTIMWDKTTGKPIYDAIVWQSRQSSEIVKRYKDAGYEDFIKEKTGLILDSYFSATKIKWIFENVEGARENENLLFGTVDTWLLYKLTNGKVHATDVTNASRTCLMNIKTLKWDEELLKLFDIPEYILPEIKNTADDFGRVEEYYLFSNPCPINALVGDQQAALFGESCFKRGESKNTYGTGGFLLINTGDDIVNSKNGLLSTVAWSLSDKIKDENISNLSYALEGSIFVSGSLIQWLRDGLRIIQSAKQTEEIAKSLKDNGGVYIIPSFTGMGAPHWNEKAKGAIFGLTRGSDYRYLVRASLEAMAYQVKDLIDAIENDIDFGIDSLKVDGGASENNFLLQFQSDILGIDVIRNENKESTALGAARLAGLYCNYFSMDDFRSDKLSTFSPKLSKDNAKQLYDKWLYYLNKNLDD